MTPPPLDGLRVLAVSQFGAGPFGTAVLATLGAEVIKIEGDSLYFQGFNRGKTSLTLTDSHRVAREPVHDATG